VCSFRRADDEKMKARSSNDVRYATSSAVAYASATTPVVYSASDVEPSNLQYPAPHLLHQRQRAQQPAGGGRWDGGAAMQECAGCGCVISERYLLRALDRYWHEDCLKCSCCDCRLGEVGSTLFTKANLLLCRRDYLRYTLPVIRLCLSLSRWASMSY